MCILISTLQKYSQIHTNAYLYKNVIAALFYRYFLNHYSTDSKNNKLWMHIFRKIWKSIRVWNSSMEPYSSLDIVWVILLKVSLHLCAITHFPTVHTCVCVCIHSERVKEWAYTVDRGYLCGEQEHNEVRETFLNASVFVTF